MLYNYFNSFKFKDMENLTCVKKVQQFQRASRQIGSVLVWILSTVH